MKHILTAACVLFLAGHASGQKTELNICLNAGLFSFSGQSAEKVSSFNYNEPVNKPYANNPYGSGAGLSYGLSANIKRILKCHILFGADAGYERLRSKVSIDKINDYTGSALYEVAATGQANLNYDCINLHPFIGYRFSAAKINIDVTGGFDLCYILGATEKGKATGVNDVVYTSSVERKTISTDIRPRMQVAAAYGHYGVYAGYSLGIKNYKAGFAGGINDCYARMLRFGITCRLL